jgi:hypothetical protein
MLNLSEHLKKMVDDERGPCGCDEASKRQAMSLFSDGRGSLQSNSIVLEFY